jgi:phosphoribosyl 1,2-cyclic phosphodiesterase
MRLEFWGVRGSAATPDADKVRYGGNTLSVVVTVASMPRHYFVLDAGTGLARFGSDLLDTKHEYKAHVLLSNLHLYHIIGLQFTPLAYSPLCHTVVIGPNTRNIALETVFDHIMSPSYSPVYGLAHLRADAQFDEVKAETFTVQDVQVTPVPFGPGTDSESWGYRLSDGKATVAYVTDVRLRDSRGAFVPGALDLVQGAQLLIVGAFDPSHEREHYVTYQDGLELARQCGATQLCFTHHHPKATDNDLDAVQQDLTDNVTDIEVIVAAEGTVFEL